MLTRKFPNRQLASFKLLHGRSVRELILILKEMWTDSHAEGVALDSYRYVFDLEASIELTLKLVEEEVEELNKTRI